ncbi:PBECR4 domain-containing protein [Acetatifactor muris]|uniref:PBECR4 domain-containing protein n=1 Tax=Acetatifactor muris TaxID=879566 RepID=UPI00214B47BC|nr:PBECR4 domain-containing protein [Acetatifactor muris]
MDLTVSFQAVEFHHLMGLHKLHDLRLSRANREKVFSQILSGQITLDDVKEPLFLQYPETAGSFSKDRRAI